MFEFAFVSKMQRRDTKTNYRKLADKYLSIARPVAEEMQANKDVIGWAVLGSTARGDVHPPSNNDLLVLVKDNYVYRWERRTSHNVVVNITLRSRDVLERMAREHPDTIFGLGDALILYDPQGILQSLKDEATITEAVED